MMNASSHVFILSGRLVVVMFQLAVNLGAAKDFRFYQSLMRIGKQSKWK